MGYPPPMRGIQINQFVANVCGPVLQLSGRLIPGPDHPLSAALPNLSLQFIAHSPLDFLLQAHRLLAEQSHVFTSFAVTTNFQSCCWSSHLLWRAETRRNWGEGFLFQKRVTDIFSSVISIECKMFMRPLFKDHIAWHPINTSLILTTYYIFKGFNQLTLSMQ